MTDRPDILDGDAGNVEFYASLQRYFDGDMTADEHNQFVELLRTDDTRRSTMVDYLWNTHLISESLDVENANPDDTPTAVPATRRQSLLQWASRHPKGPAIAIAATLLIAALVVMGLIPVKQWIAGGGKAKPEERESGEKKEEFVAKLSNWHNDVWLDGTRPSRDDPRLKIGRRLKIESGLIEVTYLTGAKVVIEGPAEFWVGGTEAEGTKAQSEGGSLDAANAGYLRLGSLVARVEGKKAQGFTIDTPTGSVEDLGTEFGVEVQESGAAEFVVLSGEVDVISNRGEGSEQRVRLVKDQGASIAVQGGEIKKHSAIESDALLALRRKVARSRALLARSVGPLLVNGTFDRDGKLKGVRESITGWALTNNNAGWQTGTPWDDGEQPSSAPNVALLNSAVGFPDQGAGTELTSVPLVGGLVPDTVYTLSLDVGVRDQGQFGGGQNIIDNLDTFQLTAEIVGSDDGVLAQIDAVPSLNKVNHWHRVSFDFDIGDVDAAQQVRVVLRAANTGDTGLQFVVDSLRLTVKHDVQPELDNE